ncbi:MAG: sigma-54 dependent transcriptional regulator [Planctomycetota bacterium]
MDAIVIDTDPAALAAAMAVLTGAGWTAEGCADAAAGWERIGADLPTVAVIDNSLTAPDGRPLLAALRETYPAMAVVVMAADASTMTAVEAVQNGAADFVGKPADPAQLREAVTRALKFAAMNADSSFRRVMKSSIHSKRAERLVGRNPGMLEIYKTIGKVAQTKSNVLITGESGTGKELVARMIAQVSGATGGKFTIINCSAIPATLFESELFGYERGAFTGAVGRKPGKVESCRGGILFLDEIDTLPLVVQSKILRLIQQKEFQRVGGVETLTADVRIVAAAKADIEERVKRGEFKEDLYYRLSVIRIALPPLRERKDDIVDLFNYFLTESNRKHGRSIRNVSNGLIHKVLAYDWPGNIRELENAVERAVIMTREGVLTEEHFPFLGNGGGGASACRKGTWTPCSARWCAWCPTGNWPTTTGPSTTACWPFSRKTSSTMSWSMRAATRSRPPPFWV